MKRTVVSLLVLGVFAAATLPSRGPQVEAQSAGAIVWRDCEDGFECGTLKVPLDHSRPGERPIEIAVARLPAANAEERIGPLFVHPGGPGGSGIDYARFLSFVFPPEILDRFDIVGFDQRGVGRSTAIDCVDRLDEFGQDLDQTPDTALEEQHIIDAARQFGEDCRRRSAALIQHVDTASAARDMDRIRAALGDQQITYFGVSYGTFLGAVYADLFPTRVRAAVLDAGIDPSADAQRFIVEQAALGFERAFQAFLDQCSAQPACPLGGPDPGRAYDEMIARIEDEPLTSTERPGQIDDAAALGITLSLLYDPDFGWILLANAIRDALEGDAYGFLLASEGPAPSDEDEPPPDLTNSFESFSAVACVDLVAVTSEEQYERIAAAVKAASPRFGEVFATGLLPNCAFWPRATRRAPEPITAAGAPPILVVGATRDPATPYEWSQALASQLASGTLLTYDGDGHVAYGRTFCIDERVNEYLLTLAIPPPDTVCGGLLDAIPDGPVGPPLLSPDPGPAPTLPAGTIRPPETGHGPATPTPAVHRSGLLLVVGTGALLIKLSRSVWRRVGEHWWRSPGVLWRSRRSPAG
jgi:pimeloyl-ACP methyl ester carboxylesterase